MWSIVYDGNGIILSIMTTISLNDGDWEQPIIPWTSYHLIMGTMELK
jgi:hypothetical protein